jgi:hypothetical protein
MNRKKRRRGLRLDDYVVGRLPIKRKQYTLWDLVVQGCGVRISAGTKSCVISVRLGERKKFETVGRISADNTYEHLRELAIKRIGDLKRERLPRTPLRQFHEANPQTLRHVLADYITAHPALSERTIKDYQKSLARDFGPQMDQPASLLASEEILRLNQSRLQALAEKDLLSKPPAGFWAWQGSLTVLRAVLGWHAAQKKRPNPWPDRRALTIRTPPARELPIELQSVEGRRRLIEGLKTIDSQTARADRFICYTGLRRREGTKLMPAHLIGNAVLEFRSKTRTLRIPLSRQASGLIDIAGNGRLLKVGENNLRKPLIRIFGERETSRGKRARVTPHDLRRLFKSIGAELGIDPTIMNLLVGHTVKGINAHYLAKLRLSVLRAAAQRIADEIDNPQDPAGLDDAAMLGTVNPSNDIQVQTIDSYLVPADMPSLESLKPSRHPHYLRREDLHKLVWTAPVSEVAARIGISDVGLAKACRRAEIPIPARGYWARVGAGQPLCEEPLPPGRVGIPELIRITSIKPPQTIIRKAA